MQFELVNCYSNGVAIMLRRNCVLGSFSLVCSWERLKGVFDLCSSGQFFVTCFRHTSRNYFLAYPSKLKLYEIVNTITKIYKQKKTSCSYVHVVYTKICLGTICMQVRFTRRNVKWRFCKKTTSFKTTVFYTSRIKGE